MAAVKYERIVEEDLNLGIGTVDVTMPAGGTAVGHRIGPQTFTALGFIARLVTAQPFLGSISDVVTIFDEEVYDPADWYNAQAGIFTAEVAGIYRVDGYAYMESFTGRLFVSIYKNNSYVVYDEAVRVAQDAAVTVSGALKLEVGDTVSIRISHTDGGNTKNVTEGQFSVMLIGRTPAQ